MAFIVHIFFLFIIDDILIALFNMNQWQKLHRVFKYSLRDFVTDPDSQFTIIIIPNKKMTNEEGN